MHESTVRSSRICSQVKLTVSLAACFMGAAAAVAQDTVSKVAFRNSVNPPPPGYTGPVFQLSHNYPKEPPKGPWPWLEIPVDFTTSTQPNWEDYAPYLDAMLNYVVRGQSKELRNEIGWRVKVDGKTSWYHVPWMAFDPLRGREFTHGCTNERTATYENFVGPLPFGSSHTDESFESWAFGVYNPIGAYSIGQTFPKSGVPQVSHLIAKGLPFQRGTLVAKVLFATATPAQVPFLKNSPKWTVNGHTTPGNVPRDLQPVRLVQMDIAVVDPRSPMGWVFATFAYNGTLGGPDKPWWERLSPVGLQWGSDPWSFPAVLFDESQPVIQSVLAPINIYEHDGANGRLAGPVDNPESSCLSCHQGAFAANPVGTPFNVSGEKVPPIFGFEGLGIVFSAQNSRYFQNTRFPAPYPDPNYLTNITLDTSLQYQVAFKSYASYLLEK